MKPTVLAAALALALLTGAAAPRIIPPAAHPPRAPITAVPEAAQPVAEVALPEAPVVVGPAAPASPQPGVVAVLPVGVPDPDTDLASYGKAILKAYQSKDWGMVVALAIIGLVWALRKYAGKIPVWGPQIVAWLSTRRGGAICAFLVAFGGALAAALAAGAPFTVNLALAAFGAGVTAIGGYIGFRRIVWPDGSDKEEAITAAATANAQEAEKRAGASAAAAAEALNRVGTAPAPADPLATPRAVAAAVSAAFVVGYDEKEKALVLSDGTHIPLYGPDGKPLGR